MNYEQMMEEKRSSFVSGRSPDRHSKKELQMKNAGGCRYNRRKGRMVCLAKYLLQSPTIIAIGIQLA